MSYKYPRKSSAGDIIADILIVGFFIALAVAFFLLVSWGVEYLWNGVMVDAVTWANKISFWEAVGLNLLVSILFGTSNVSSSYSSKKARD